MERGDARRNGRRRWRLLLPGAGLLALVTAWVTFVPGLRATRAGETLAPTTTASTSSAVSPDPTPSPTGTPTFDRNLHSITDPASIWVVVDKARPLSPVDYAPADLVGVGGGHQMRAVAAAALRRMFGDAAALGLRMRVDSAYRSYAYQQRTFASAVARLGRAEALRASAKPGYSEHQTGLAADIGGGGCDIETCFADTAEGRWVAENGYRYGFVIRYPAGEQAVTGYKYEPWHVRFVGEEPAREMHDSGVATLEEFFDLPPAPTYAG